QAESTAGRAPHCTLVSPGNGVRSANDVSSAAFAAVIVPGWFAPDYFRRDPETIRFVKDMHTRGRVVAAICHGPWLLCSTGALKGKRATSFFAIKDDVVNAGASWVDEETVVDGNVITARKPDDLPAFTQAIFRAIKG